MRRLLQIAAITLLAACSKTEDLGPSDGGGGQGGTAGNGCGVTGEPLSMLYADRRPGSDVTPNSYAGPAIAEASTTTQLILAFQQEATGGSLVTTRVEIRRSLRLLPILPVGARVWFAQTPLAEPFPFGPSELTFSLRDREGGTLLLGAAKDMTPPFDEPLSVRGVTAGCAEPYQNSCFPGSTLTHQQVEIAGDTVVTIADLHTGTVGIGGVAYDVSVGAQSVSGVTSTECLDAFTPSGVSVAVLAHDPAPIIAGLEVAAPASP